MEWNWYQLRERFTWNLTSAMSDTTREQRKKKRSIFSTLLLWHNSWKRWVCTVGTTQKREFWVEIDSNNMVKYVPFKRSTNHRLKACIKLAPNCLNSCTIKVQTQDLCHVACAVGLISSILMVGHYRLVTFRLDSSVLRSRATWINCCRRCFTTSLIQRTMTYRHRKKSQ